MGDDQELELRDYLRVLNRRRATVAGVLLLVVVASLAASFLQTPIYRSEAELLLQPRSTESIFDPSVVQTFAGGKSAQTEIRVLKSQPVRALVVDAIGQAPPISASNPAETDFIIVSAEATSPEQAARIANAYSEAYAEYRRRQAVSDLEKAAVDLQGQIDELDSLIAAAPDAGGSAGLRQERDLFATRLGQIRLAVRQKTGGVQVVTPAVAISDPVRPTPSRNAVVAVAVGLMLGVGLAFLRDYLDDSITTKEDLERTLPTLPVLGLIPDLGGWKDRSDAFVVTVEEPASPAAEAYRSLRTSVQFLGVERQLQVIQVTSASQGEGKSTTIANLAVSLARAGQRVVVVCCDLRRPRIHEFFGVGNDVGLTSALIGGNLPGAVQPVPGLPKVAVLASGPVPPNPSELLGGAKIGAIIDVLRETADVVLIDCPPILPVTDAAVLAARVDGTLLVASADVTHKKDLIRAAELLRQVDAPLLGLILNGVRDSSSYGYRHHYRPAYKSTSARPSPPKETTRLRA